MAWVNLRKKFEPDDGISLIDLKQTFTNFKMESEDSDQEEYMLKLEQLRSRLVQAKATVTDTDLFLHILGNLPDCSD